MCGRFVLARASSDLAPLFDIAEIADDLPGPSYNFAPSEQIAIVMQPAEKPRRLASARWGLVPPFKKSLTDGPTPFNARCEKLFTSGMYRFAMARRRAIIPVDGFYERRKADRQSYFATPSDGGVLALAGLYEWWQDRADPERWVLSATIITRPPQGEMVLIHDRQPLYLAPRLYDDWLDPAADQRALLDAAMDLSGGVATALEYRKVGSGWLSAVPGQKRDDPGLIDAFWCGQGPAVMPDLFRQDPTVMPD
ncbi:MAG: SOS response-associated peptidase [Propionibacteriaceae bacterium]|jgi:putative SOS response-associated peptidase YedK|nr:SOS response-associated peptidase [Propionibacteriaceae bacterium]